MADRPSVAVSALIAAPPEALWPILTDIAFPARHSTEFRGADWLDGVTEPAVGARFEGRNANPTIGEWTTVSTVTECHRPEAFSWAVGDPGCPLAEWGFRLRADGDGSAVTQWFRIGLGRSGVTWLIHREPEREHEIIARRLAGQRVNMRANLEGVAAALGVPISADSPDTRTGFDPP